ncbi:MAG: Ig-like domain-containing protein [Acidobacteriia bacterium]|nr:Ig-like domain-containing protein [Terriglobia bacterium]
MDLGSSGPLLLPDQPGLYPHELVAGGKEGTLYLVNRDNEGQFNSDTDDVIQTIPHAVASEIAGVPSYWNGSVYMGGDVDYLKQYSLVNGLLTPGPVSQTTVLFGGAGPASTSITANGNRSGILWAIRHTTAALFAFDPNNLATKFYDSTQALKARDKLVTVTRFVTPTISNGKVYVGGTAALAVYGLLPSLSVGTGNNQTGVVKTVLPVPLTVVATDAYASGPLAGVPVTCKDGGVGGVFLPSATQTTDAKGTVTYSYQLPSKPRALAITCSSLGYTSALFSETSTTGPPARMTITSGNRQIAPPNTPLPAPLVVKVVDSNGLGVPGVTVTFSDNGAGGTLSASSVITSAVGIATTQYTTGPNTGKISITASTAGVASVNFVETVQ